MRSGPRRQKARAATVIFGIAVLLAGCSGGGGGGSKGSEQAGGPDASVTEPGGAASAEDTTTLPPGAQPGLDDYDGDGRLDPTCGTQDFGGGLVLRIPCEINTASEPAEGTRLVPGSLFRLPGPTDVDLNGISGSLVIGRDVVGGKVVIVVFNSDNLFETGSATIGSTDTMDNTIRLINRLYPGSAIQVRGHTDSTGTASANQTLSERRAAAAADYLRTHGVNATSITSIGFGSSRPLTEERNPDGSDSVEGRRFNRRVEIALRLPK